jgi:hypothetical protein
MLLTKSGERIYIHFEEKQTNLPSESILEQRGLQSDVQITSRFTNQWYVGGQTRLPDAESVMDQPLLNSVYSNFFGLHEIPGSKIFF